MPHLTINTATIHYRLHGTGQPLILIAGYSCDHTQWLPMMDDLGKHFQVLIFDNRGCGQTKDDGKSLSVELLANDVIELANALNLQKPHIAGHSMGGMIAQQIASQYPDKIDKLAILSSTIKLRAAALLALKTSTAMLEKDVELDLVIDHILPFIFSDAFLKNPENITAFKQALLSNPYLQSIPDQKRQTELLQNFDGAQLIKMIKAKTLIVYGKEDILSLPYESELMADLIPGSEVKEMNSGHGLPIEMPGKLVQTMIKFFK